MTDVLLTSVPDEERALAQQHFPRAVIERAPLDASMARRDVRVLVVSYADRPTRALLGGFPRLEALVTRSDGYDHLPLDVVPAYNLGDYAVGSVAHHALAMLIALLHRMPEGAARTRAGSWSRAGLAGRHLGDITLGILGAGRIGSEVARLATMLGARVLAHDIVPTPLVPRAASLDDLLARSDALTVHVPLDESTRGMLGARELARLPRGALLMNTARGDVVDPRAVAEALRSGQLAGYAADVLPGEPRPSEALALYSGLDNVLLTPHTAAYDARTLRERYARSARICEAVLSGGAASVAAFRVLTPS